MNSNGNPSIRMHLVIYAGAGALCFLLSLNINSPAQTFQVLHQFGTNALGPCPNGRLVQAPNGTLYGTTETGGLNDLGQIYAIQPDGTGLMILKDFTGTDGANPTAGVILSGNTLYGTTSGGGTHGNGTVFSIMTDGTGFIVLKALALDEGTGPVAGLVVSGVTLYGVASRGGREGYGTVFKLGIDGSDFAVLHSFEWVDGVHPLGEMLLSGNTLYGTAADGGLGGSGTVFKVNTDGSNYAVLKHFQGSDGQSPSAGLALSDTTLYGTTFQGGNNSSGTVFKLETSGTGFAVLHEFEWLSEGSPLSALLISGTTIYGTARQGGNSPAAVFRLNVDGSNYTLLKQFDYFAGDVPGLILSATTLFGVTPFGGGNQEGTLYKLQNDGSDFGIVTHFGAGDGKRPKGNLLFADGTLYGATEGGGCFGNGVLFKMSVNGDYRHLRSFDYQCTDGAQPNGSLVLSGSTLYGTALCGGTNGSGTVYQLQTNGGDFSLMYEFSPLRYDGSNLNTNEDGALPEAGLAFDGAFLFGSNSSGGTNGFGTLFKVRPDGSGYALLHTFTAPNWNDTIWTNADGYHPAFRLVLSENTVYGSTSAGGSMGCGTIFKCQKDGTGFTILKEFADDANGSGPNGLVLSGSTLFGTTFQGGTGLHGTVFKISTDDTGFTVLKHFNTVDGAYPVSDLVLSGDTLFGTTLNGGSADAGTVFQIKTDGSAFAVLKEFTGGADGGYPRSGLAASGTTLYGTTTEAGHYYGGVLFSISLLPALFGTPLTQTTEEGAPVTLLVQASALLPLSYQWFFNGALMPGCTKSVLSLSSAQSSDIGSYSVAVSSISGAITSAPAILNVIPPVLRRPVPALVVGAQPPSAVGLEFRDKVTAESNWSQLGTVVLSNLHEFYFDLSTPLPSQRVYRAWRAETMGPAPTLTLPGLVPALTLRGTIGDSVRIDYINQFGPIDAWAQLDQVTLTNTAQIYCDVSALGQPPRLFRVRVIP